MTSAVFQRSRILLHQQFTDRQVRNILAPVGFDNWQTAYKTLQKIAGHSPKTRTSLAKGLPSLLMALGNVANPNQVLVSFERFVLGADNPTQILEHLSKNPRGFEILATLFAGSQFLTGIVLRHPEYFEQIVDYKRLAQIKTLQQLQQEAQAVIAPLLQQTPESTNTPQAMDALRRFQRYELVRIGTSDLLGLLDLPTVTLQLTHLADSLAQAAITLAAHKTQTDPHGFAVIGMGKLGGEELNYSSDIDLIFLAESEPNNYWKMGQAFINILDRATDEGFLYRVDMRLRPWGKSGALINSVDGYIGYLQKHASLWERQALIKARTVAGTPAVGKLFLQKIKHIIFNNGTPSLRAEIHKLKQRIESRLSRRGRTWGEVKLGQGSIRDIEFVTQYLQLTYGPRAPDSNIAANNTLKALSALATADFLAKDEYRVLTDGYIFLRTVEHHLQLMHYRQTHTLPQDAQALNNLARRLGFQGETAGKQFTAQYQQHSAVIRAVYQHHLANDTENLAPDNKDPVPNVLPLLVRMHPNYAITFSDADIKYHARLIEELDENNLVKVEVDPLDDEHWKITIVGYDYLGVLSLICGLLVVHGLDIVSGNVFSYRRPPVPTAPLRKPKLQYRKRSKHPLKKIPAKLPERKIVDVFTVRQVQLGTPAPPIEDNLWTQYAEDLATMFQRLHQGKQRQAQGKLAQRIAVAVPHNINAPDTLYPVEIQIDNVSSNRYTILRISALDTFGFLYEFTNALALVGINIRQVEVDSKGSLVQDILYVTNTHSNKITSPEKQRELRVAAVLIKHFTHLLPRSPNPESALLHFREFLGQLFTRPNWPNELTSLEEPEVLSNLARLLGISDFLWSDFLRMQHANLFPVLRDLDTLTNRTSRAELREDLAMLLHNTPRGEAQHIALNAFKDREMFRIDMRKIQGYTKKFGQFSSELSDLAEVIIEASTQIAVREVRPYFGLPRLKNSDDCPMVVCALGKCGGRELGFASDIELMFIFAGPGRSTGPRIVTTSEYFTKIVHEVSHSIQTKREGIFELDLRLRPYGGAGSMSVSMEAFKTYFGTGGDAWPYERQALVKLRPIAGDLKFGQEIVRLRDELIYSGEPFDVAAMRAMRERQIRHLVKAGTVHAKFSPGALVDAEYLVQGLQISHGHKDPSFRNPNTRAAMRALAAAGIIPAEDFPRLQNAYGFLRNLINALRMVRGNAKDLTVPPPDNEEFNFLARRLDYGTRLSLLQDNLTLHTSYVQEISRNLLG